MILHNGSMVKQQDPNMKKSLKSPMYVKIVRIPLFYRPDSYRWRKYWRITLIKLDESALNSINTLAMEADKIVDNLMQYTKALAFLTHYLNLKKH